MKVKVVDLDNKDKGEIDLDKSIYGLKVDVDLIHRVVEWQRSASRSGNHKTKGISEISGTTKKPFKQKGTGRARQGSLRSPHMRGGAVIFGPVVRSHEYSIQKKVRKLAIKMVLSQKCSEQKCIVVDSLTLGSHKTKDLNVKLSKFINTSVLFVGVDLDKDQHFLKAYRNLKAVDALPVEGLNVYDVLKHDYVVLVKDSLESISKKLS
ncbi:MAG: 50S ribosomal protein L4 [Rickettsiales bacterium]|nr:50S ribosomal protein L4 [Rickettsiales bacterium]